MRPGPYGHGVTTAAQRILGVLGQGPSHIALPRHHQQTIARHTMGSLCRARAEP